MKTNKTNKLDEILGELFDSGKRYGEDIGYAKDEVLYEKRILALSEAKQAIIDLIEGEIIGELEEMRTKETLELHSARNLLKLAQRQKLQKLKE